MEHWHGNAQLSTMSPTLAASGSPDWALSIQPCYAEGYSPSCTSEQLRPRLISITYPRMPKWLPRLTYPLWSPYINCTLLINKVQTLSRYFKVTHREMVKMLVMPLATFIPSESGWRYGGWSLGMLPAHHAKLPSESAVNWEESCACSSVLREQRGRSLAKWCL